jgi:hypothetical protein
MHAWKTLRKKFPRKTGDTIILWSLRSEILEGKASLKLEEIHFGKAMALWGDSTQKAVPHLANYSYVRHWRKATSKHQGTGICQGPATDTACESEDNSPNSLPGNQSQPTWSISAGQEGSMKLEFGSETITLPTKSHSAHMLIFCSFLLLWMLKLHFQ